METEVHFLEKARLPAFLGHLPSVSLYGTVTRQGQTCYSKITESSFADVALDVPPPVESVKGFLFPAKERVAVYGGGAQGDGLPEQEGPLVLMGARACDVAAVKILDKIFLEGERADPFYEQRRREMLMITTDCVAPGEYCFCNLLGGKPYAEDGFDVNLSAVEDGYLVTAGSEKGGDILQAAQALFLAATADNLAQRDQRREDAVKQLETQNKAYEPKVALSAESVEKAIEKVVDEACACVECGACSYICPTCHCFLLFDQRGSSESQPYERQKTWDSCILSNFAKMAGVGGFKPTPRPDLRRRFENRVQHKFVWMLENLNVIGCVGCGRCEAACMGGSDIRELFQELTR